MMGMKTLKIRGMRGAHCERAVYDSLSHIAGVTNVSVSEKKGIITFRYDSEHATLMAIKDAITDEGYDVIG